MGPIQNNQRAAAKNLHPGGNIRLGYARLHRLSGNAVSLFFQQLQGRKSRCGVFQLMGAQKRKLVFLIAVARHGSLYGRRYLPYGTGRRQNQPAVVVLHRMGHHAVHPFLLVWVQHYIAALLHNTAFLKGDLLHSIPQNSGMIQRNRHDDCRQGSIDDVGGIKASAQPHFQHNDITFFLIKPLKRQRCDQLEFRDNLSPLRHFLHHRHQTAKNTRQRFLGNLFPVDLEPLSKIRDIRGGKQAGPVAGLSQHGGKQGAGGALAVSSCHMNKF